MVGIVEGWVTIELGTLLIVVIRVGGRHLPVAGGFVLTRLTVVVLCGVCGVQIERRTPEEQTGVTISFIIAPSTYRRS